MSNESNRPPYNRVVRALACLSDPTNRMSQQGLRESVRLVRAHGNFTGAELLLRAYELHEALRAQP